MNLRKCLATATTVLALGAGMALGTTPASASASGGYISGVGDPMNDWGDEGLVSSSAHSYSNVTAMWQAILWADKAQESNGSVFDFSDIDCRFGPNTTHATRVWQARHGLGADGIVGPNTFGQAQKYLRRDSTYDFTYVGDGGRYVTFWRRWDGDWAMYIGSDLEYLAYNSATFNVC
jgi:peptidoglycan hydrolase-like protein with peptidoglycan-binding domain